MKRLHRTGSGARAYEATLEDCPFCGGMPNFHAAETRSEGGNVYALFTIGCKACGYELSGTVAPVDQWNRREGTRDSTGASGDTAATQLCRNCDCPIGYRFYIGGTLGLVEHKYPEGCIAALGGEVRRLRWLVLPREETRA